MSICLFADSVARSFTNWDAAWLDCKSPKRPKKSHFGALKFLSGHFIWTRRLAHQDLFPSSVELGNHGSNKSNSIKWNEWCINLLNSCLNLFRLAYPCSFQILSMALRHHPIAPWNCKNKAVQSHCSTICKLVMKKRTKDIKIGLKIAKKI